MTPREYEVSVAEHFRAQGYRVKLGPGAHDGGIDVLAAKGPERLAIQAKMYGGTTRRVNREQIQQLYGAAAACDCTGSVLVTDGDLMPDAEAVARKLGVRVLHLDPPPVATSRRTVNGGMDFDAIWERYVMPLAGTVLRRDDGSENTIVSVDWATVTRITSGGTRQRIRVEIFRDAIERVLAGESVSRDWINQMYPGRASSGIMLILAQVPMFEIGGTPECCRLRASR